MVKLIVLPPVFEKPLAKEPKEPIPKKIICKCPYCERLHERDIKEFEWTGRGIPRVKCLRCSKMRQMESREYYVPYSLLF